MLRKSCLVVAVCAVLCASDPILKLPVLKKLPSSEVNFGIPNQDLVLECVTENKEPNIKYSWLKDGKPYTPQPDVIKNENEGTLIFKKPDQNDEGKYQCLAATNFGTASSRTITVKKYFIEKPKVTLKKDKPIEGRTYKLECEIPKSYPKPEIVWTRQSLKKPSENDAIFGQRYTISPEGTLYFSNVTKEDTSTEYKYVCLAKSPVSDDLVPLAEYVLEDVVPDTEPKTNDVIEQYVSKNVVAKAGEQIYLYCIYGGNPLAHPDWFKDGKDINNSPKDRITRYNKSVGKRLLIKETWVSDQGEYTCVVDNEVGRPQKNTIQLTVVSEPQFLMDSVPTLLPKRGEDVKIPCSAAGIPPPQLKWTLNAHDLSENDRVSIERSQNGNTTVATLTLKAVNAEDNGYYGCHANNQNGDSYTETLLYVK